MARAGAAISFRDCNTKKAHLGEAFPEFAIVWRLAVDDGAHRLGRAFLCEKFPRRIAQLFLVVGKIKIHTANLQYLSLSRRHADRAVEADGLAVKHRVL